jgi:glyoxylate carboligase
MSVAKVILSQLGGNRFVAMTGAKNLAETGDQAGGLAFMLPARFAKNGINAVKITLDWSDTYVVKFLKIGKSNLTVVSQHDMVYCDQLVPLFEQETGLYTHL